MGYDELSADIIYEIGIDAHSCYEHERYSIEELALHLLADAVIVEFLKGFFDFETLGKGVRAKVDAFIATFRKGPQLVTLDLSGEAHEALTKARVPETYQI